MCNSVFYCRLLFVGMCLINTIYAHPSYLPPDTIVPTFEHFEYTPTVLGHTLHALPTAVSHQSQTIVHEKRPYLRPVVKTFLKTYTPSTATFALPLSYSSLAYSDFNDYGWNPNLNSVYGGWSTWPLK